MAKIIHTIDSEDFLYSAGFQSCGSCPVGGLENFTAECKNYFKFLFENGCDEIEVKPKSDYKLKVELEYKV